MASFIERCGRWGGYEDDGGDVDISTVQSCLVLYEAGLMDGLNFKGVFNCTQAQGQNVDEILATMPALSDPTGRARWPAMVAEVLRSTIRGWPDYDSEAKVRAKLGLVPA